jgi:Tc5 transposase DNA-binding domain
MIITLECLRNGTHSFIDHAVKVLEVARTTLRCRVKGGRTRQQARELIQLLIQQQEKALADWITSATASAHPIIHRYIKEMAQGIRENQADVQREYLQGSKLSTSIMNSTRLYKKTTLALKLSITVMNLV